MTINSGGRLLLRFLAEFIVDPTLFFEMLTPKVIFIITNEYFALTTQ